MNNIFAILGSIVGVILVLSIVSIVLSEFDTSIDKTSYSVSAQQTINKSVNAGYTATKLGSVIPYMMIFGLIMSAIGLGFAAYK